MIKDKVLRTVMIPVLGIFISLGTGLFRLSNLSTIELVFSLVFFVFVMHLTWQASLSVITNFRANKQLRKNILLKLVSLATVTAFLGAIIFVIATSIWQWIIWRELRLPLVWKVAEVTAVVMLVLTLIYEAMFLHAELEIDAKVLRQLDEERLHAEASLVQKDLDPHFLFNCLNSLSYLVRNEPERAYQFVHKLSNVFKYLLINKKKDFVTLAEELQFLNDYYFLLQVRFDDAIQLQCNVHEQSVIGSIPPCTLQMLLEHAIKQNFFSEKEPLVITISMENDYLNVTNGVKPKPYKNGPTNQGLTDVKTRFSRLLNKEVQVIQNADQVLVRLPFGHSPKAA